MNDSSLDLASHLDSADGTPLELLSSEHGADLTTAPAVAEPAPELAEPVPTASEPAPSQVDSDSEIVDPTAPSRPRPAQEEWQAVRRQRWEGGVDWPIAIWIGVIHLGALAAPFFFTWKALLVVALLGWLTGGIGICLGFHRLFTHSSFATYRPVRWLIGWIGGLAGEGSVIHWTAVHREHHAKSDELGDPHSPLDGPWWAHMFWFLPNMSREDYDAYNQKWAPDLMKDPVLRFLDKTFILWHLLLGGLLFAIGYGFWDTYTGWSFVTWGMFVRMVWVLHSTWFVNSATHIWGYRNYETRDESRNLWWVALMTYGEGWHNNHHAYPRMARHGHRWWEFDATFLTINLMKKTGLAWNVVDREQYNLS